MTRMHSGVGLDINVGCFELLIVVVPARFHSSTHSFCTIRSMAFGQFNTRLLPSGIIFAFLCPFCLRQP